MGALRSAVLTARLAPGACAAAGPPAEAEGCLACRGNPAIAPKMELGAFGLLLCSVFLKITIPILTGRLRLQEGAAAGRLASSL